MACCLGVALCAAPLRKALILLLCLQAVELFMQDPGPMDPMTANAVKGLADIHDRAGDLCAARVRARAPACCLTLLPEWASA